MLNNKPCWKTSVGFVVLTFKTRFHQVLQWFLPKNWTYYMQLLHGFLPLYAYVAWQLCQEEQKYEYISCLVLFTNTFQNSEIQIIVVRKLDSFIYYYSALISMKQTTKQHIKITKVSRKVNAKLTERINRKLTLREFKTYLGGIKEGSSSSKKG